MILLFLLLFSTPSSADDAVNKASEAVYIQSGLQDNVKRLEVVFNNKLTMLKLDKPAGYAFSVYNIYLTKRINFTFNRNNYNIYLEDRKIEVVIPW